MSQPVELDPKAAFRQLMEYDPWIFSIVVCKRDAKAERHHRPLLYLYTRRAELLCACLSDPAYDGTITEQVKADFLRHKIDWENPAHMGRVRKRLRRINIRMPRSSGKSTFADDGDLWDATVDPDMTISIGSKSDPFAQARISTIGKFVLTPEYAFWFPDRVPDNPRVEVTQDAIWLKGRKRIVPEATIEGRGITSQWTGRHYRKNRRDDIVGTESGEASLDDALRHMANIDPLHDETGWEQDVYVGTINGENDDHSVLAADDGVLTVVVPIEEHEGGTTLDNIYGDGILTLPEWFDRERVNEIKSNAKKNPTEGPIWLLQNYYMAAHKSGTSIFSARLIEQSKFEWVPLLDRNGVRLRDIIRRPKLGMEKVPRSELKEADWFYLDPLKALPSTAKAEAVDQSVSESGESDRWAMGYVCADWEAVYYVLDSLADHGYNNLLGQLVPFHKGLSRVDVRGDVGEAAYMGIDSNATQSMTVEWLKRSEEFAAIARKVKEIRASGERKDINIRNWVQAQMLTGHLYINPKLFDWISEALKYRPYKSDGSRKRRPKDDQLDMTWMAMSLVRIPPSPDVSEEEEIEAEMQRQAEAKHFDRNGICTDDWMDELPSWRVA